LPSITQAVIVFSHFVKQSAGWFFLFAGGFIAFALSQRNRSWFKKLSSTLLLSTPVVGDIIRKIYLARFANTMALLSGARIPMLQAIQLTQRMISFYPVESSLNRIGERIMNGDHLYKSLAEHKIYPQKMISVIKVAEEVNQLELFFSRLAEQYSNEVEHQTNVLSKVLEPLIIVVLGLVVGVILIAMYLPLFKLGQTF
jgi:type IV pilus assembly protein PilC